MKKLLTTLLLTSLLLTAQAQSIPAQLSGVTIATGVMPTKVSVASLTVSPGFIINAYAWETGYAIDMRGVVTLHSYANNNPKESPSVAIVTDGKYIQVMITYNDLATRRMSFESTDINGATIAAPIHYIIPSSQRTGRITSITPISEKFVITFDNGNVASNRAFSYSGSIDSKSGKIKPGLVMQVRYLNNTSAIDMLKVSSDGSNAYYSARVNGNRFVCNSTANFTGGGLFDIGIAPQINLVSACGILTTDISVTYNPRTLVVTSCIAGYVDNCATKDAYTVYYSPQVAYTGIPLLINANTASNALTGFSVAMCSPEYAFTATTDIDYNGLNTIVYNGAYDINQQPVSATLEFADNELEAVSGITLASDVCAYDENQYLFVYHTSNNEILVKIIGAGKPVLKTNLSLHIINGDLETINATNDCHWNLTNTGFNNTVTGVASVGGGQIDMQYSEANCAMIPILNGHWCASISNGDELLFTTSQLLVVGGTYAITFDNNGSNMYDLANIELYHGNDLIGIETPLNGVWQTSTVNFTALTNSQEITIKSTPNSLNSTWTHVDNFEINSVTGVEEVVSNKLVIYPNPCTNSLTIKTDERFNESVITSVIGNVFLNSNTNPIDVSNLPSGVYVIKVNNSFARFGKL